MRLYQILGVFIFLTAGFANARAAEETAVVTEGRINVRGKPSLIGEVITQLERGEKVTILDRITNSTAKAGEPTNWAKIKLPPNTPVWVFSPFVKDGVVSVSRLNVRAGRGERFSVIARLNRGESVKPIRTMEEWMEIEQPTNAFAFVDSDLLQTEFAPSSSPTTTTTVPEIAATQPAPTTPPVTSTAEVPQPATAPDAHTNATVVATAPATSSQGAEAPAPEPASTEPATEGPASVPAASASNETALPVPEPLPPEPKSITSTLPEVAPTSPLPQTLPQVAAEVEKPGDPPPKRVVRREGIVRATTSIQAPTWYELEHIETKKRINYLFADGMDLNLKDYRGQKVVVTGEEAIDSRWPNTPILDMQTLDVLP